MTTLQRNSINFRLRGILFLRVFFFFYSDILFQTNYRDMDFVNEVKD